jgi:uncharacterized protein YndB with AHSA1/START domain
MSEAGAATRSVVFEKEFAYPPARVWRALTEGDLIQQWLMENDFKPVMGHRFQLRSTPMPQWNGVIECEVLLVEPQERLTYSWEALGLESVVAWTLTPTAGGTLLRMEHSGFREDQEHAYKGAGYGWQKFLGGLDGVLATMKGDA